MKIAILGTRGIPNSYGGFEQFAEFLSVGLSKYGHDVTVYSPHFHSYKENSYNGVNIIHKYSPEKTIGGSANFIYDYLCLKDALKKNFDIILECGYGSVAISYYLTKIKKSIVVTNMDGMEWKRAKWKGIARKVILISEKLAVKKSHSIITDNICIHHYYKAKYGIDTNYIPYGADSCSIFSNEALEKLSLIKNNYYMLVTRLEPENNIEMIIEGVINSDCNEKLIIISYSNTKHGNFLKKKYESNSKIIFHGSNYDISELNSLRHFSKAYFHGHSIGGTNPSLLEAMASEAFIIANKNIYNEDILGDDALYFNNSTDIARILNTISKYLDSKEIFVNNNKQKISQKYSWDIIISQYDNLFKELLTEKNIAKSTSSQDQ